MFLLPFILQPLVCANNLPIFLLFEDDLFINKLFANNLIINVSPANNLTMGSNFKLNIEEAER